MYRVTWGAAGAWPVRSHVLPTLSVRVHRQAPAPVAALPWRCSPRLWVPLHPYADERGCEDMEHGGERAGKSPDGFRHGDGIHTGGTSIANNTGHETRVRGKETKTEQ